MKKNPIVCFKVCARLLLCVFLLSVSVPQSMAGGFIRDETYPFMATRDFAFMDSVASFIANTDLHKMESTWIFYKEPYKGKIDDFIFDITFYHYDKTKGRYTRPDINSGVRLRPDGSYRLSVRAYGNLYGSGWGYLFNIGKLRFFSDYYLFNYFTMELNTKQLKCFFNTGYNFNWSFVVDNGKITAAYGIYGGCEVPDSVIDLISGKIITYQKYIDIFEIE